MLRVAIVGACGGWGGAAAVAEGLARYQRDRFEVTGLAFERQTSPQRLATVRRRVGRHVPIYETTADALPKVPGIVYCHDFGEAAMRAAEGADVVVGWCLRQNAKVASLLRVPYVEWIQNCDDMARALAKAAAEHTRHFVACSRSAVDMVIDKELAQLALPAGVTIIRNAADPEVTAPRFPPEAFRRAMGLNPNTRVALFLGRLVDEKNPQLVASAAGLLNPDWETLLVGSGPAADDVRAVAEMLSPGRCVHHAYCDQVADLLYAADVVLLPSDFEGDPVVVHEAHLAGKPVVASESWCQEDRPGVVRISAQATPDELADAINRASAFDCSHAQAIARTNFTLPVIVEHWAKYLTWVVDGGRYHIPLEPRRWGERQPKTAAQ